MLLTGEEGAGLQCVRVTVRNHELSCIRRLKATGGRHSKHVDQQTGSCVCYTVDTDWVFRGMIWKDRIQCSVRGSHLPPQYFYHGSFLVERRCDKAPTATALNISLCFMCGQSSWKEL